MLFIPFIEIDPSQVERFLDAAQRGDVSDVVNMLNTGMPVDSRDGFGWTALHLASFSNRTYIVRVLLQRGADVNVRNVDGMTPLHRAAGWNSTEVIKVLLEHGASRNIRNNKGRRPVDLARRYNRKEAVRLLNQR